MSATSLVIYNQTTLQTYLPDFRKGQLFRQYGRAYFYMREMIVRQHCHELVKRPSPECHSYLDHNKYENNIVEQQSDIGWTICTLDDYNTLLSQRQSVNDCDVDDDCDSMWLITDRHDNKIACIDHQWALQIYRQLLEAKDVTLSKLNMFIVVFQLETVYNGITLWLKTSYRIKRM